MNNKKFKHTYRLLLLLLGISFLSFGFMGDDITSDKKNSTKIYKVGSASDEGGKKGDSYRLNINNINLPMNRTGVIAAVNIPDPNPAVNGENGKFGGHSFLFSSGFFLSGYSNGVLFSNAVASASLVEDYLQGTVATGQNDPRAVMYVVKASDPAFGTSWNDWKDAVALGAEYYDGDGDGAYNPTDKNGNGEWDADEDMPDLLGDETVWCVYYDGKEASKRRWNAVDPLGIEVRQTVFAFASAGAIGNIIFLRYKFKYVGLGKAGEPDELTDVFFGVWADPDLGDFNDDLVGVDVPRNAGYSYNDGSDVQYGDQPPCFMIDFFSGPAEYIPGETYVDNNGNGLYDEGIDTAIDTAYSVRGQLLGKIALPGARNLPISSFVQYINGDPDLRDPNDHTEARNYILGLTRTGTTINPCTFSYGTVMGGVDCSTIDPRFWYSGDPVPPPTGWIATSARDIRQMTNVGPFKLRKGEEKEIVVAYVVGQGENALSSITAARAIDDGAQVIFDNNFLAPSPPPAPVVKNSASEKFIDLLWDTPKQLTYRNTTETYDIKFGGYNVYAFKTFNPSPTINNQPNRVLIGRYQVDDFVKDLYAENGKTGGLELLYSAAPSENRLNSATYSNENLGRLRFRLTQDPFTKGKLIKGKPYYLAVTSYGVNHMALNKIGSGTFGEFGDYFLSSQTFVQGVENVINVQTIVMGQDLFLPPVAVQSGNKIAGGSGGMLQYDVIDKDQLTGDKYKISLFIDSTTTNYSTFWKLENTSSNTVLKDSSKEFLYGSDKINKVPSEGFIIKLSDEKPNLVDTLVSQTTTPWHTGAFYYLAKDMGDDSKRLPGGGSVLAGLNNNFTRADKIRRVELRFDQPGKAYRYLNGFVGAAVPLRRQSYMYAAGVVSGAPGVTDAIAAEIGKLGEGFVDVPFTAWVEDEAFGEKRQLAVGFLERKASELGKPDGVWDPHLNVNNTGEYIFIFNQSYDPNGGQQEYQGNFAASSVVWADLRGYTIPADASASGLQRAIAKSPFFDVLYAVGISKKDSTIFYNSADKFIVQVGKYPYTSTDIFEFQTKKGGALTEDEEKELFAKVNVYPNPLYGYNIATSYTNSPADEPFVTFTNLPNEEITIKIYSLAGSLLRVLNKDAGSTSPFLQWDLENEAGLRVASGLYLAIVSSPKYGEKVLKFSIIMPQKQLQRF